MKIIAVCIVLLATLVLVSHAQAQENTVEFSILPGPLSVDLVHDGEFVVLTVDDATGTSLGWWVTVECDCAFSVVGEVETVAGQEPQAGEGPYFLGRSFIADPLHGVGIYRITFAAEAGIWSLSYGQGLMPAI